MQKVIKKPCNFISFQTTVFLLDDSNYIQMVYLEIGLKFHISHQQKI